MALLVVELGCLLDFEGGNNGLGDVLGGDGCGVPAPAKGATTKDVLADVAIAALIIAGSIAAYKAMGKPCACPSDLMKNGRSCGGNSAYSKPNGYKPLCFPTDITTDMIKAYRATKTIPALF